MMKNSSIPLSWHLHTSHLGYFSLVWILCSFSIFDDMNQITIFISSDQRLAIWFYKCSLENFRRVSICDFFRSGIFHVLQEHKPCCQSVKSKCCSWLLQVFYQFFVSNPWLLYYHSYNPDCSMLGNLLRGMKLRTVYCHTMFLPFANYWTSGVWMKLSAGSLLFCIKTLKLSLRSVEVSLDFSIIVAVGMMISDQLILCSIITIMLALLRMF